MRTHGTISCYTSGGCRCDQCREAGRLYARDYRARKLAKAGLQQSTPRRRPVAILPTPTEPPRFARALCATVPADQKAKWFAIGTRPIAVAAQAKAKAICERCPERDECASWAIAHPGEVGIWGGLTEAERQALRDEQAVA